MLLFIVLAVIPKCVPVPLAPPCETSCRWCNSRIAVCDQQALVTVPSRFPPEVFTIDLHGNKITQLPRAAFTNMSTKLSRLNMSNNCLLYIEDNAFDRLSKLWSLDLSRNNLTLVTDYIFRGLRRLRDLYLQNNRIEYVSNNAFLGIINIRVLNFRGNRLTEVPWPAVRMTSAVNLQKFDVSRNMIQRLYRL
ncbi:leucine-rich repeat-containing protein 70-like [Branchiostoma lanceolatum]|uniref:leucine-rich repeat-containing protein 70-like n=1 Tax=Branchiostoma lanceolatum TaxID=7740 RepID=UPI003455B3B7